MYIIDPDGLSGDFLFNLKFFFSYPLLLLFKWPLDKSTFSDLFKLSSITLILKKGDTSLINNYWLSLLCLILLNCLSILFYTVFSLKNISILIDELHGFRLSRSSITCNLVLNDYYKRHLNREIVLRLGLM